MKTSLETTFGKVCSIFGFAIFLLTLSSNSLLASTSTENWLQNEFNGHEYSVLQCGTWSSCHQQAANLGGYLVAINDQAEQDWLVSKYGGQAGLYYWIGLTDQAEEENWVWTSGEPVTYLNWATGEPNNGADFPFDENYAAMNHHVEGNGTWNDVKDDATYEGTTLVTRAIVERVGWQQNPDNGHDYKIIDCGSWTNCKNAAAAEGGYLVTINDQLEQDWLVNTFGNSQYYWIGLTDQAEEGTWIWDNGEEVTFTNWAAGEPNNGGTYVPDEDFAALNHHVEGNGKWNDVKDDAFYGYTLFTTAIVERANAEGTITIILESAPESYSVFNFTSALGNFKLVDSPNKTSTLFTNTVTFTAPPAGTYTFTQTVNSRYYLTQIECTPDVPATVNLQNATVTMDYVEGDNITCIFANERYVSAYFYKYNDLDGSGKRGYKEPYLPGWELHATDSTGIKQSKVTNIGGMAKFEQLRSGNIEFCETQQSGWKSTFPGTPTGQSSPCITIPIALGKRVIVRFGNQQSQSVQIRAGGEMDAIVVEDDSDAFDESQSGFDQRVYIPIIRQ